jgi:membrane-bound lytic murein transglycosylase B
MTKNTSTHLPFSDFVASLRDDAVTAGISPRTIDAVQSLLIEDDSILQNSRAQPEHAITATTYVNRLVTHDRIYTGQQQARKNAATLARIKTTFGVPPAILLAIWGIESNFGENTGNRNVIQSLANLCLYEPRRTQFWRSELQAAMQIVDLGSCSLTDLVGSWAGAMGHMQFMPSTYLKYAIDDDDDGIADIWHSIADGLASAANYLKECGWRAEMPWGMEVLLTNAFDFAAVEPDTCLSWNDWHTCGIARTTTSADHTKDAHAILKATPCRLVTPAGSRGPAFLVSRNFDVLLQYNRATIYALSVGCLADRISGLSPLETPWPDEPALSRSERIEIQQLLTYSGLDTNGIDGIFGSGTVRAVRTYQGRHGLTPDGHANAELLGFMRSQTHATGRNQ